MAQRHSEHMLNYWPYSIFGARVIDVFLNGLSPITFTLLVISAGLTSCFTASFGAGGGVMLLGVMAQIIPPQLIIPLHGVVQLGSNASRSMMSWRHIDWPLIGLFLPGALIGAWIGHSVLTTLPAAAMYLSIAGFIVFLVCGPKLPKFTLGKLGTLAAGAITTFLTLFVGATGPLVAAFLKQVFVDRFRTVATFATAMSLQHILKIAVFEQAGFPIDPWLPLLLCMVTSGAVGTWLGLKVLKKLPDRHFHRIFNVILMLLAGRLFIQAFHLM